MNRIDEMLRDLCPDGVEYRRLGEIATLRRGKGMPKSTFESEGIGAIHYGHIYTRYGVHSTKTEAFVSPRLAARRG